MTEMTHAYDWHGRDLVDRHGDKVGTVVDLYVYERTAEPEWAAVRTGLFGKQVSLVPIRHAEPSRGRVRVPFDKQQVEDAPRIDPEHELSERDEAALYEHYGMAYTETRPDSPQTQATGEAGSGDRPAAPVGRDASGPTTDDAMTRSEEEVRVGAARRERGRVRLRKYVVTEHVQQTVPVRREEVRVEREPITEENVDQARSGPEISEEEHEVVLYEEQPVVEKRVVPKERVRLTKETVSDEAQVTEEVRKERIEAEEQ
jgi:uncharacterized protein (TIGR02271 family)